MTVRCALFAEYPAGLHWTPGEVREVPTASQPLPNGFDEVLPVVAEKAAANGGRSKADKVNP